MGPAGTLFAFRSDALHGGCVMTVVADQPALRSSPTTMCGHGAGRAERATRSDWLTVSFERAAPRERSAFGFPAPATSYWDEQTLADTQTRYPRADLTPYR